MIRAIVSSKVSGVYRAMVSGAYPGRIWPGQGESDSWGCEDDGGVMGPYTADVLSGTAPWAGDEIGESDEARREI